MNKSRFLKGILILFCLLLCVPQSVLAEETTTGEQSGGDNTPEVVETYSGTENPCITWYVRGVIGEPKKVSAYVGTEEINVSESGLLGDKGGYAPKTLILIDNSSSMSKYKGKIQDILLRLIWNHQNVESFSIATFGKEKQVLSDFTDNYDELRLTAENITYKGQSTYLRNILYSEIKNLSLDKKNNYNRIVLISNGADDSILGVTYEELTDLLDNDSTSCPIYTIGCTYKPSESELDKLFALSRRTGSPYFLMDDYEDATKIADAIDDDGKAIWYFSFNVDAESRDGSEKTISLLMEDDSGEQRITHVSYIPLASTEELKKLEEQRKQKTAEGTKDNDSEDDHNVTASETNAADGLAGQIEHPTTTTGYIFYYLSQNGLWITLFLLVGLAGYVRFAGIERRKNKDAFVEADISDEEFPEIDEQKTITKGIVLLGFRDTGVKYFIGIGQEKVIGRLRSRCDIAFPEDRAMSARQALIRVSADVVQLENLDTQRGTVVDGETIIGSIYLKNGSYIRIGNTDLRVTYE